LPHGVVISGQEIKHRDIERVVLGRRGEEEVVAAAMIQMIQMMI
jgi:hypothetical protein